MITRLITEIVLATALSFLPQSTGEVLEPNQISGVVQLEESPPKPGEKIAVSISSPADLDLLFTKYSQEYKTDETVLKKIANCESHFNPNALNGDYGGMFQFSSSTWSANRQDMGLDPNPDLRFQAEESIRTTAYKIAKDGIGAWPVCGKM